ncbi:MAG: dihydrofolate reductase family protein [Fluviicola sp.]
MTKTIAAMNMSLDGFCDHTLITPNDEMTQHYNDLLKESGHLLYGRTTYQLMEDYWPLLVKNPSGNKTEDEFAVLIDNISKVVFSHTLKEVSWKNSRIATRSLKEEVAALGKESGAPIFIGSPGLIAQALEQNLVDELQIMIHPVIAGKGLVLFKNISDQINLKLVKTTTFKGGAVLLFYQRKD